MTLYFPGAKNMNINPNRSKGSKYNRNFNDVLQVTIKETLLGIFGAKSTKTIFKTMEKVHSIRLDDVSSKSHTFDVALKDILGTGHQIVEDMILENLFDRTGKVFEYRENFSFSDYVNSIKDSSSMKRS